MAEFIKQDEFNRRLAKLADENWLVRKLLATTPFDEWPPQLKADAYKRLNLSPEQVFRASDEANWGIA